MIGRRDMLLGGSAVLVASCAGLPMGYRRLRDGFAEIRARLGPGGRLGVAALDVATNRRLLLDEDSAYAMCSTFKMPLAAAILAEVDRSALSLTREVRFGRADLVEYAPVVEANLGRGRLTIEALCAAAVEVSDNVAANLLLREIGGPSALTAFMRRAGDRVSRLDRTEPELNTNLPGDKRDTTTPAAMVGLMRSLLLGDILSPASRTMLLGWMERSTTGRERLRAGLPASWRVGDKTGTGANRATNVIAIAWPPGGGPILIACFMSGGDATLKIRNAAHAAVARMVVGALV